MIYFIYDRKNDAVKIGCSMNPKKRFSQIQTGNAGCLTLVAEMEGDQEQERELHTKFRKYNKRGEWFVNSRELREYIYKNTRTINRGKHGWVQCLPDIERKFLNCLLIYSNYAGDIVLLSRYKKAIAEKMGFGNRGMDKMLEKMTENNCLLNVEKNLFEMNPYLFNLN